MIDYLQKYIGEEIVYNGSHCQLIEVLNEGPSPSLVLMCVDKQTTIQTDQHGGAHRRVHETYTISCISELHNDLHPIIKQLLPEEHHDELRDYLLNL